MDIITTKSNGSGMMYICGIILTFQCEVNLQCKIECTVLSGKNKGTMLKC